MNESPSSREEYQARFVAATEHWLDLFDAQLAENNISVSFRPFQSAAMLVQYGIEKIHGGKKDDYYEEDWFASIVVSIRRWYVDRYGVAALKHERDVLAGIAEFRGTLLRLAIPVSVSKVEVEGETAWMILPSAVHELETVRSFFTFKPNLDSLSDTERSEVEEQVRKVVRWTRTCNLTFQGVEDLPPEREQLPASVIGHLHKAVNDLLTLKSEQAPVACWELHLAVEKAIKVLLAQNGIVRSGHDLPELAALAEKNGLLHVPKALALLPSWKLACNYRYAETAISTREAYGHYLTALEVLFEVSSGLRHFLTAENPAFLLKKPKWVLPEEK